MIALSVDVVRREGPEAGIVNHSRSELQGSLCVQVSDQCPPETDEPAREYLGRAVENGQLKPVSSVGGAGLFVTGESA